MSEPLYGHDLLSLLVEKGGACGLEELRRASVAAHGTEAVYCNCGGDSFDFDGVLAFLRSKGKVSMADGTVSLGMAPACQH
jgi:probable metal-binding protein